MRLDLAYGKSTVPLEIPDTLLEGVLKPQPLKKGPDGIELIRAALDAPIGTRPLAGIVRPGERVVVITSDITRPLPSHLVLPPLLESLLACGCRREDVTIVFGLGCHRRHSESEQRQLVGNAIFDAWRCIDHDPDDVVSLGRTPAGTPVEMFRPVVEADRRILVGNIEYHYFAGYSGGAKALLPACCTYSAIQANHSLMIDPRARAGAIDDNPVRADIDSILDLISADMILNVVLDEQKTVVHAVAGHPIEAHRAGCRFLDQLYKCPLDREADIVIVSPGGYPKDINLYQAQKALDNARQAVRPGGAVIWLASCGEGFGETHFEHWMKHYTPSERIAEIRRNFILGGHKAAAIALVQQKADVLLVSDLDDSLVRAIGLTPQPDLQAAWKDARQQLGADSRVLVMPYGGSTLPKVEKFQKM